MPGYVHLHPQPYFHADAFIVADRQGLQSLRDAIDRAIEGGKSAALAFVGDGEGYTLMVIRDDEHPRLMLNAVPYTDDCAVEQRGAAIWPHQLVTPEEYQTLYEEARKS